MDQLVGLSDDLGRLDAYVESITRKVAAYLGEVLEDQRDKLQENLLANNSEYIWDVRIGCDSDELGRGEFIATSIYSVVAIFVYMKVQVLSFNHSRKICLG